MMRQQATKLILIGFMGTGKSVVSERLAARLGWQRIDSDEEIVRSERRSIAAIFETDGEKRFREIESAVLNRLLRSPKPAVLATGGGIVLSSDNRAAMLRHGFVIALQAEPECIIARVSRDRTRPLLQGDVSGNVRQLLKQRKHAYDFAHIKVDTTHLVIDEVVHQILAELQKHETLSFD